MEYTIEHGGRVFAAMTREQILAHGVPVSAIDDADAEARSKAISAECRRRIYAEASGEAQMNMATATAVISGKSEASRSEDEQSVLASAEAAIVWVSDMRLQVQTLTADPAIDPLSDAAWPDIPPEVQTLMQRF